MASFYRAVLGAIWQLFPLLSMAAFLLIVALAAHAQRSAVSHKAVVVRQVAENQSCTSNCQVKEAWITIPHAVGDLLKGHIGARQVHDTPIDGIPMFPRKVTWIGRDEADLAREFDQHVQANIVAYATAMTAWQSEYGLATATHDIVQRVTHRGRAKRVIVNVFTFDNGNYYYNGARVMPEDANAQAQILYVRAIPLTVTSGLPLAWNWPGRGTLAYELRGPTFEAGSGMRTIGVGSTYDEPFDYSGTPFDPDARLVCLVDKAKPGCGQRQPDVKTLLGLMDATYAVLDYHRRVKPSGIRYGSGYVPQLTARVTDRVATFACPTGPSGTYSQVFRYTMKVESRIDRYLVFSDGRYYLIQSFRDVVTPSETAVSGSSPIARAGEYLTLGTRFLHHRTGAFTDASAYTPNVVSLEPVTTAHVAAFCGCAPQAPYSETRECAELNDFWVGTYTRNYTYNAPLCSWSMTQDSSTCVTDWCLNLTGYQSSVPAGTVRVGRDCNCTAGRTWNSATSSCQCPAGSSWDGSACVTPPSCSLTQDLVTTTPGQPFTLRWTSSNATSATLVKSVNGGVWGSVPCYPGTLNGECQPTPVIEGSHLFRFSVASPGGTNACEAMHYVQASPPVDVCDNIPGVQSTPPAGTVQSGSSCVCTGGRTWNGSGCVCTGGKTWNGSACVCPSGTIWDGANCIVPPPVDVCDNIPGNQAAPPFGTIQSGTSCICTGGRTWSDATGQCECPSGTAWNGGWCAAVDVCDNIAGIQTSPPPDTVQSGSSCLCSGGRNWSDATVRCECPSGTSWNGATCTVVTDECESINGAPDPTIQSSLPAGLWRAPGTRQCFSGDRFSEPGDNWALSCFATASGYSSPVSPGPSDWGYDPSRLALCNVASTGGSGDYCLAYTRKEDAYGQYWGITPLNPVIYPFSWGCISNTSVTYFPGHVP